MKNLAIIGGGVMGSAILESLLRKKIFAPSKITVIDLDGGKLARLKTKFGVQISKNAADAAKADAVLLAVKPQSLAATCESWETKNLVISILAGTKISSLSKTTGSKKIARVMPNTPAQVGAGVSGWIASKSVTRSEKTQLKKILESFGTAIELRNEKMIDAVTAISGSGPAYFFAFAEALEAAAKEVGLGKNSRDFAAATFLGAALLADNSKESFSQLKKNVTSKGGTTAAALKVFEKEKLGKIVSKAAKAAKKRSEELGK